MRANQCFRSMDASGVFSDLGAIAFSFDGDHGFLDDVLGDREFVV
ncbi:hypothetical protein [Pseudanabaena biceps]|nr:hypothetical protein [Pseudanabaena biceps]